MSDFKAFVKQKPERELVSTSKAGPNIAACMVASGYSSDGSNRFASELIELANSEPVLTELSNMISEIRDGESEDEFVERAKSSLSTILNHKLDQ